MFIENVFIEWNENIDEDTLSKFGLKKRRGGESYYFMRYVAKDVSLNISYSKRTKKLKIDVLDENFLQPYDYQFILKGIPNQAFAKKVKSTVDSLLNEAQELKIISGFNEDNYIYSNYKDGKCSN